MLILYNLLLHLALLILLPALPLVVLFSKKRRKTILQRSGLISVPVKLKNKRRIWVHALSVGEVKSALPLIKELRKQKPDHSIIFTTSTLTGFQTARDLFLTSVCPLVDGLTYFPYDLPVSVKNCFKAIDPDLVVIVETDLWPNFLYRMHRLNIPVILVNARLSKRSLKGYLKMKSFFRMAFSWFSIISVQTEEDARRFRLIGLDDQKIIICGNIKFDQDPYELTNSSITAISELIRGASKNQILLAGSTHEGEEDILGNLLKEAKASGWPFTLVIAPRNCDRSPGIVRLLSSQGHQAETLSEIMMRKSVHTDCVVIDKLGILSGLYGFCDIAYIGGSLVNRGGHNPLEPAAFSKPVLFGPYMTDFELIARWLVDGGGAFAVLDAVELRQKTQALLLSDDLKEKTGKRAKQVFTANQGAVAKNLKLIDLFQQPL